MIILWSVIPDFTRETYADADAKQERIILNYVCGGALVKQSVLAIVEADVYLRVHLTFFSTVYMLEGYSDKMLERTQSQQSGAASFFNLLTWERGFSNVS